MSQKMFTLIGKSDQTYPALCRELKNPVMMEL